MMQCKKCGRDIPANSKLCPYCGQTVISTGASGFHTAGNIDGKMPPVKRPTAGPVGGSPATENPTIKSTFGAGGRRSSGGSSGGNSYGGGSSSGGSYGGRGTGAGVYTGKRLTAVPDEVVERADPIPPIKGSRNSRRNGVLDILNSLCGSPIFLVAVACLTVGIIMQFVGNLINATAFTDWIEEVARYAGMGWLGRDIGDMYTIMFNVSNVLTNLPSAIAAMGLWFLFFAAKSNNHGNLRLSGLSVIRVIAFIRMGMLALGFGAFTIIMLIGQLDMGKFVPPIAIVTLLGVAIGVCAVFYEFKVAQTVGNVHNSLLSGTAPRQASSFVGVLCVIVAVLSIIVTLFSSLFADLLEDLTRDVPLLPSFSSDQFISIIGGTINSAAMILLSVLLFMYNGRAQRSTV